MYDFNTGDNTSWTIALSYGMYCGDCKGTGYFSDFRLEEVSEGKTNEWNVLVVVFKNIKAPITVNGKKVVYEDHISDAAAKRFYKTVQELYTSAEHLTQGLWKVRGIDLYISNATVKELQEWGYEGAADNYMIGNTPSVAAELDKALEGAKNKSGRCYQQIFVGSPINGGIASDWAGLGGGTYNGINFAQWSLQEDTSSFKTDYKTAIECGYMHEMLHCVNARSSVIDPSRTIDLHSNVDHYNCYKTGQEHGLGGNFAYYSDYTRLKTPDGKGVVPEAFRMLDESVMKTTLIYGKEAEKPVYASTDIQSLSVSKISDKVYSGKAVKPGITIKDGARKLVKGTDYTLSYIDNKTIGKAAVVITGKGKYCGSYARTFNIVPKKQKLTAAKLSNGKTRLKWTKLAGVSGYELYAAEPGSSKYTLLKKCSKSSSGIDVGNAKGYSLKIRPYKSIYPTKYRGAFSNVIHL